MKGKERLAQKRMSKNLSITFLKALSTAFKRNTFASINFILKQYKV